MKNKIKTKINIRFVFEVILILCSLYISVSPLFRFGYFKYSLVVLSVLSLIYFFIYLRRLPKIDIFVLLMLSLLFFASALVNGFANFDAYVAIIMQVLIAMIIASGVGYEKFRKIFVITIVILAGLSLIFFSIQCIFPDIVMIFPSFDFLEGRIYTNQVLHNYMFFDNGIIFSRNPGICWEPGCFQGFLNLAMFFIFQENNTLKRCDYVKLIILFLALVTTTSMTGYILFAVIFLLVIAPRVVKYLKHNPKKIFYAVLVVALLSVGVMLLLSNSAAFREAISKLSMPYNGELYIVDRISLNKVDVFFDQPLLNILFGNGESVVVVSDGIWNSILYDMLHVGVLPVFILLYGYWCYANVRNATGVALMISFLLIFSTESLFHTVIFLIFCCQGFTLNKERRSSMRKKNSKDSNVLRSITEPSKKVLWTTNVVMPYPARRIGMKAPVFGGWLSGLMGQILSSGRYKLAVAAVYGGDDFRSFENGKVTYYLLPCRNDTKYDKNLESYWRRVIEDFQPDLVHLHGTEFAHNLALENACPNEKYLVSLQGIMKPYADKYLAGISEKEFRKNRTFRDFLRGSAIKGRKDFYRRAVFEDEILKKCTAITGRTEWDQEESAKIAGKKPYYKCNEILRDSFYDQDWNVADVEPYSIYVSQASYPIKGFHVLLDALPELVKRYPNVKVYVGGTNIMDKKGLKKKISYSGYAKILENKIKRNRLESHVEFLGEIHEDEVLEHMKECNVFVQCSSIENSPNSLGEAMLIGMPCVASNAGGTADLLDVRKEEGLLYEFGNVATLTRHISEIFDDPRLAEKLGKNAQKHAKITHDRQKNLETMLSIYEKISSEN